MYYSPMFCIVDIAVTSMQGAKVVDELHISLFEFH